MKKTLRAVAYAACFSNAAAFADAPPGRYTYPDDATVYDVRTKLTWQRAQASKLMIWTEAQDYCAALTLSGSGWRLPNRSELVTLVDLTKLSGTIDATAFPNTQPHWFWSATSLPGVGENAFYVSFDRGDTHYYRTDHAMLVRCVR